MSVLCQDIADFDSKKNKKINGNAFCKAIGVLRHLRPNSKQ